MHQAESSQNDDKAKCIEDCINGHSVHSARIFFLFLKERVPLRCLYEREKER